MEDAHTTDDANAQDTTEQTTARDETRQAEPAANGNAAAAVEDKPPKRDQRGAQRHDTTQATADDRELTQKTNARSGDAGAAGDEPAKTNQFRQDAEGAARFFPKRDGRGKRLPQDAETDHFGPILTKPLNYGDVQRWFGRQDMEDLESAQLAVMFDRYVQEPDLHADAREHDAQRFLTNEGKLTAEYVESMHPLAPAELVMALVEVSDLTDMVDSVEPNDDGGVTVEQSGN